MSLRGVEDEDLLHLDRERDRAVRRRSRRLLGSLLRPLRLRLAATVALVVLAQGAKAAGPLLVAVAVDRALPELQAGRVDAALLVAGGYLGAAIATGVLTAAYIRSAAAMSQAILFDLRTRVFRQTQRLSLEFHERYTSGRIIARQTSDLEALKELLDSGVNSLVSGMVYMVFILGLLLALDPLSGLLLLAAAVPMIALTRWFQKRSQVAYRGTRTASARVIVHFVETMTGIRAVQAFRRERQRGERFTELADDYRDATLETLRLNGVYDPGLVLIGNVTVFAVLLVDGFRVLDGGLALGVLIAAVLYSKRFFAPIEGMGMFYNSFQSAAAALEKVSGLLEEEPGIRRPERPVPLPHPAGRLDFDRVRFAYADGRDVLPRLELSIPAGQTVALVGATGAGKSTIAKLVTRFYDPVEGGVRLDGVDLREVDFPVLRSSIVMVTQEAFLFSGSIADNIALGRPDASDEEIEAAAQAVGAHEFILQLPDGYDTDVNKRGSRLSSGQRQLVSFARAFLADPAVLVLDEATSALDLPSERLVQQGLERLLRGRTAIIIAHRLSTVEIADRVLVIDGGRIVEDGSPQELIAATGRFASLHAQWQASLS